MTIYEYLTTDQEILSLKKEILSLKGRPYPFNTDEYEGTDDYKKELRKQLWKLRLDKGIEPKDLSDDERKQFLQEE